MQHFDFTTGCDIGYVQPKASLLTVKTREATDPECGSRRDPKYYFSKSPQIDHVENNHRTMRINYVASP